MKHPATLPLWYGLMVFFRVNAPCSIAPPSTLSAANSTRAHSATAPATYAPSSNATARGDTPLALLEKAYSSLSKWQATIRRERLGTPSPESSSTPSDYNPAP
jgi:hypothetical protein